jgi:uncharacterized protein YdaU (DUF1376 family)
MPVELSRMDFHVTRFMTSEDVQEMDAGEVGQYCLLLFNAWMIAKDVTLPVEPDKLARYARVEEVSPAVLKKFPKVETQWGVRRRNASQLEVWEAAKARTEVAKKNANMRWHRNGNAVAYAEAMLEHTIPEHTRTEQSGTDSPLSLEQFADKVEA